MMPKERLLRQCLRKEGDATWRLTNRSADFAARNTSGGPALRLNEMIPSLARSRTTVTTRETCGNRRTASQQGTR